MMATGRHSRCLCGPAEGLGAHTPAILAIFQCLGALRRLRCFLGPRAMVDYNISGRSSSGGGNGIYGVWSLDGKDTWRSEEKL